MSSRSAACSALVRMVRFSLPAAISPILCVAAASTGIASVDSATASAGLSAVVSGSTATSVVAAGSTGSVTASLSLQAASDMAAVTTAIDNKFFFNIGHSFEITGLWMVFFDFRTVLVLELLNLATDINTDK